MFKEAMVAQEYHVTVLKEITRKVGQKSSKFPSTFDGPSLWSTIESLGHYAFSINKEISSIVSEAISSKQAILVETILIDL